MILDDAQARQIAEGDGLRVIGLLGLLVHAKEQGLITAVKPLLDEMMKAGFYVAEALYRNVIEAAGEDKSP